MSGLLQQLPEGSNRPLQWPWHKETNPSLYTGRKTWPKISIVTPSFQQGGFIEETIRSVLLQNYPNLEYIVIDGGSTDETVDVLKRYSPWITYWSSEPDEGQSDALNKGFERSTGEICAYINSDDLYMPGAFHNVAEAYLRHHWRWMVSDTIVGTSSESGYVWKTQKRMSLARLNAGMSFAQQGVFWKNDITRIPYFDKGWFFIMDLAAFFQFFRTAGPPYRLKKITSFFREHPQAKSTRYQNVLSTEMKAFQEMNIAGVDMDFRINFEKELIRIQNKQRMDLMVDTPGQNLYQRITTAMGIISLMLQTPFVFRDRYFISTLIRFLIGRLHT